MRDALMRLLESPIEALAYELVDIEFARQGRSGVLRIFIDRNAADADAGEEGVPFRHVLRDPLRAVSHVHWTLSPADDPRTLAKPLLLS